MSEFLDSNDPAVRFLAQQIAALRREMRTQARAAQGPLRSVDITAGGTTYYAEDGTPMMEVGTGEDGEFGIINVDPSPPPVPEAPDVTPAISGIVIAWDGTFIDSNWTTNTSHVEVHVSDTPDFEATDATQVTVFSSQSGGEFTYATPNDSADRYVALVAVSLSGVESDKSEEVAGAGLTVNPEVAAAINELIAQVDNNTEEINNNATDYENLALTTQILVDTTASIDGRVSTSDYSPGPEDVAGRIDGSIWFARTRPRKNLCVNPSAEVSTAGMTPVRCALTRVADTSPVDGAYAFNVVNDGTVNTHYSGLTTRVEVEPGADFTASAWVKLMSGSGVGYQIQLAFFDAAANPGPIISGPAVDLTADYQRMFATTVVPDLMKTVGVRIVAPSTVGVASDVWRWDGGLYELSPLLGSYFDGTTYDCKWDGTAELSTSTMTGGKVIAFHELDDNAFTPVKFSGAVLVDIDASTITTGYMDGERIQDNSIPHDKLSGVPVTAGEALAASDLVNIYSVGGVAFARKADADAGRPCHGFVYDAVANGGVAIVRSTGYITGLVGLTVGAQYLSSTAGKTAVYPPGTANTISQRIGFAVSDTVMLYDPAIPTYIV